LKLGLNDNEKEANSRVFLRIMLGSSHTINVFFVKRKMTM